jgi:hypothetical protein
MNIHFLLLPALCLSLFLTAEPLPIPQAGDSLQIRLHGALVRGEDKRVLMLEFPRWNGHWFTGTGFSPSYNKGGHRAILLDPDLSSTTLDILASIDGDAWVPGGPAAYRITWREKKNGIYQGTYTGSFRGSEITGTVEGRLILSPEILPGFSVARHGEHPRLLFKKSDLPALRKKAETGLGKRALADFPKSAVGLGVLYQLEEDPVYAERARTAVEAHMADNQSGSKMIRHRFWAYRLEQVALAYDLCYHAWPEDFREEVRAYILSIARRMYRQRGAWTEYMSWNPDAAYTAATLYSGLIGMLAVIDTPGEAPREPSPPPRELPPREPAKTPGDTPVAVSPFQNGEMPEVWAYSGPQSVEVFEAWRDANGDPDSLKDHVDSWRMLTREENVRGVVRNKYSGGRWAIEMNKASGTAFDSWNMIHARIEVEQPRTVRFDSQHGGTIQFLNGQWLNNGDIFRMEPGVYDLALACPIGRPNPWAGIFVRPRFEEQTPEQIETLLARKQRQYERDHLFWKQEKADWEALGQIGLDGFFLLQDAAFWFRRMEQNVFGRNGAQVGSTHALLMEGTALMSTVYRNTTGRPLAAANGLSRWLPGKLMALSFDGSGAATGQPFWGEPGFKSLGYQDKRDLARQVLAQHFPAIDPAYRSLALWYWRSLGDPLGGAAYPEADRLLEQGIAGGSYDSKSVYAFLHLPLDMEPRKPAETLPLTWQFPDSGRAIFRNRWRDHHDIVLQLTAQQRNGHVTFSKAGAFALRGLGHDWTFPNSYGMRGVGERMGETVVQTLHPAQNESGLGRVLDSEFRAEGSGRMRIDLSEVYRMRNPARKHGFADPYDRAGGPADPAAFADEAGAVAATRDLLVDFSGNAGVGMVLILHDRLEGVENPVWSWPLDLDVVTVKGGDDSINNHAAYQRSPATAKGVECGPNRFFVRKDGAILAGTFLQPETPTLQIETFSKRFDIPKNTQTRSYTCLTAAGGGEFLVLITLDPDDTPEPRVTRENGITRIQLGDAVYLLGDNGLRFGPAP